jgi:hypothetical protein
MTDQRDIEYYKDVEVIHTNQEDIFSSKAEISHTFKNHLKVKGSVLEFGVYKGRTIKHMQSLWEDSPIYGFDSFEGLPEAWEIGEVTYKAGHFHAASEALNELQMLKNVTVYPGFFSDTLPKYMQDHGSETIEFLHIDSDLYSSAKEILYTLNTNIVPGTIIRFDELCDWRLFPESRMYINEGGQRYTKWREGEWKALQEWLTDFNREVKPLSRNNYYSSTMEVIR